MKNKNLIEVLLGSAEILEERIDENTGDVEIDIGAKFQHADRINSNGRLYPRAILEREIDKIGEKIENDENVYGLAFHPADGIGKPSNISHEWTSVCINEKGECWGELTILPTTEGKEIQKILKSGRKLGISSRGTGTLTKKTGSINGKKVEYMEVNEDYRLISPGDFVLAPAVPDAQAEIPEQIQKDIQILESEMNGIPIQENNEDKNMKKGLKEETIKELLLMNYSRDIDEGFFRGSFEEWKAKGGELSTRAAIIQVENDLTYEEAIRIVAGEKEGEKILQKEKMRQVKVTAKDVYMEAKLMGIDAQEYAERINASLKLTEELESDSDFSHEQIKEILNQAHAAGMDVDIPEVREKVLNDARKMKGHNEAVKLAEQNMSDLQKGVRKITEDEKKKKEKNTLLLKEKMLAGGDNTYLDNQRKKGE